MRDGASDPDIRERLLSITSGADALAYLRGLPVSRSAEDDSRMCDIVLGITGKEDRIAALEAAGLI